MSSTRASGELRIQIDALPPQLDVGDPTKNDPNPESTSQAESPVTPQESTVSQQPLSVTHFVNIPLDPPPYSELPIYNIPLPNREVLTLYDPPPPYDPTMRREIFDPLDFPYQNYQQRRSSRFECKPDTLVPLGFCYCTLEQLIVTLAILGTFVFLGLGQIS